MSESCCGDLNEKTTHTHLSPSGKENQYECTDAVVSVRNVSFSYGTDLVLENISFCVPKECLVGIIGPNGGGKTTLLKLVLGLLAPQGGQIDVFGRPTRELNSLRSWIGYVPQRLDLDWKFPATVWDIVISGCFGRRTVFQSIPPERKKRVRDIMAMTGISGLSDRPIGKLSGGQQQRVFITRAVVSDPKLLVVDEPTSGIDTAGQAQFFDLIQKLRAELKLTVLMVSHHIGQLAHYSNYLACLNKQLHWHDSSLGIDIKMIEEVYGCELHTYLRGMGEESISQ
ncbi:MAG: ABC transporter ATP-binding protein [Phycisphaerae bacterium]